MNQEKLRCTARAIFKSPKSLDKLGKTWKSSPGPTFKNLNFESMDE